MKSPPDIPQQEPGNHPGLLRSLTLHSKCQQVLAALPGKCLPPFPPPGPDRKVRRTAQHLSQAADQGRAHGGVLDLRMGPTWVTGLKLKPTPRLQSKLLHLLPLCIWGDGGYF